MLERMKYFQKISTCGAVLNCWNMMLLTRAYPHNDDDSKKARKYFPAKAPGDYSVRFGGLADWLVSLVASLASNVPIRRTEKRLGNIAACRDAMSDIII